MAKKHQCPEFENHERWLVSYADMLTLLFAVFVTLFALKEGGDPQVKKAAGSMQESFNTPLKDIPIDRRVGPATEGFGIFEHMKGDRLRPPLSQKYPSSEHRIKVIDDDMNRLRLNLEERLYGPNRFRQLKKTGDARVVSVTKTKKGFKLELLARHFFASGSSAVSRSALKDLTTVTGILKDLGRPITIEGHTDSLPPRGKQTNWELSALRATSVLKYMIKEHDFPKTLLSAVGYADLKPIASNTTKAGRQLNRRIEIHVNYND